MQQDSKPQDQPTKKWNTSVIIALVAVLISSASAIIGLYETSILAEQQTAMMEQKDASVWPYIYIIPANQFIFKRNVVQVSLFMENKGIGPAILGDVNYTLDGDDMETWGFTDSLAARHPEFDIEWIQNTQIDNMVLSPEEKVKVITFEVKGINENLEKITKFINTIDFNIEFCYCSVYGKCWKVNEFKVSSNSECQAREDIR